MKAKYLRAAREMLGWNQETLAEMSGVSRQAISNFEKGAVTNPQIETINALKASLERQGVFVLNDGVIEKDSSVYEIHGDDLFYVDVLEDVYQTVVPSGRYTELYVFYADDRASPPEVNDQYRKLKQAGVKIWQLIEEGNSHYMGYREDYRCVPSDHFFNSCILVYGDKSVVVFEDEKYARVTRNDALAKIQKNTFNLLWQYLPMPEMESTAKERL